LEDAIVQFERSLAIEQHELAYFHIAGTYRQMSGRQNPPDLATLRIALHYADEVVRIKPTFAGGHGMRGDLLRYLGESEESYAAYSEAVRLERDNPLWLNQRGLLMASQNRWGEAAQDFYRQLQLSPRDPNAHLLLGRSPTSADSMMPSACLKPASNLRRITRRFKARSRRFASPSVPSRRRRSHEHGANALRRDIRSLGRRCAAGFVWRIRGREPGQ
ncbi:MAG TPA: hypothetical protein PK400_10390, partial [Phycisphaerales bacterium]|nr:hypothetical protein [Phycisphaerales bacterium]